MHGRAVGLAVRMHIEGMAAHVEGLVAVEVLHGGAELPLALRGVLPLVRLAACHLRMQVRISVRRKLLNDNMWQLHLVSACRDPAKPWQGTCGLCSCPFYLCEGKSACRSAGTSPHSPR